MLNLDGTTRSESAAAWLRLAQGISMADRVAAPSECETTVQFSLTLLKMSSEELREAKKQTAKLSIAAAAERIRPLEDHVKRIVLLGLVNIAFSDHVFKRAENDFLASIASKIELTPSDLVGAFIAARRLMDATGTPVEADADLMNAGSE